MDNNSNGFGSNPIYGANFSAPSGNGMKPQNEPVSILLAAKVVERLQPWMNYFMTDGRFRIAGMSLDPLDLKTKLTGSPEVLLIDARVAEDEPTLTSLLTRYQGAAYVITPPEGGPELTRRVADISSVKGSYFGDINLVEIVGKLYSDTIAMRTAKAKSLESVWANPSAGPSAGSPITGLRIICVWNQMGGVGKTTVSSNLAYESARRGYPTLLIGLGAPDDLPLITGIKPEPNITQWWNNPTPEGIKLSIQKLDTLDVLAGFPDVLSESQVINTPRHVANSIPNLITTAAHYSGYAVIVIDAPPSALAASALSVSNTLVLVARPSLEGIMRTVEAYRTVVDRLAGEHRIPNERVFIVLNRVGSRLPTDDWHRAATQQTGKPFPPIIAQIPDIPAVGREQDSRRLPIVTVDEFSKALKPLVDSLLQSPGQSAAAVQSATGLATPARKEIKFGPFKIKM